MSRFLGIASVQREGIPGNGKANVDELVSYIDAIVYEAPWVDLIVFPELAVQGLAPRLEDIAEPIPGVSVERLAQKAKEVKKWIIPGSMIEIDGGKVYNTMPVFSPEGNLVTKYRKMSPFSPAETSVPGNSFTVVDIPNIGRLGLCICYDAWFPEMTRTLISMGAEVIFHPSFTPSTLKEGERICRMATALFNQVYVIGTGACGFHCGFTLAGHSMIVDPEGVVLQEAGDAPSIQMEMLDLDKVKLVREIGSKGTVPMLKHMKEFAHEWPVYGNHRTSSPYLDSFGSIKDIPKSLKDALEM
jgi:Predicted amidohydrolase